MTLARGIDGVTYYFDSKGYVQTGWFLEQRSFTTAIRTVPLLPGWFEDENGNIT